MTTSVGIPYCPAAPADSYRQFDVYAALEGCVPSPVLVFVHGGAWRSEDKSDHALLARRLANATGCTVVVPNYRLTSKAEPDFRHPGHAEDILGFLEFLVLWKPLAPVIDPSAVYLIGHSCSAHMLASIILDSDLVTPTLAPSAPLRKAVKAVILSEGIYNIDSLVHRFPNYRAWFIDDAFGARHSYSQYDVSRYPLRGSSPNNSPPASWLIIHSKGDDLIDVGQSQDMYAHLCQLYGEQAESHVRLTTDKLVDGHDDILRGVEYVEIIRSFVGHV